MAGKLIGYVRVSSEDQNPERQLEGIKLDKLFIDKASGKNADRPDLTNLINYVRDGDTVIVHSMDRLARNLDDLRKLVNDLTQKEVKIHFIKENLIFTGEDNPMSRLMLSIMGAVAEFERAIIKERQKEGIELAKRKGLYKGKPKSLNQTQIDMIKEKIKQGISKVKIAKELEIGRATLYRYIK
jgi:DNA invertase Pin-like site-specific DNA recombinase